MNSPKMQTVLVPPDGGWGWIVCFAYALSNIMVIPIMQNFGLIAKEKFPQIGLSATDAAVILNTNAAFGMMMGLVNGSLLKKFGYRKMSVVGGLFVSGGVVLTSFANDFYSFLFFYGLITSLGFGIVMASFSLAINSYFNKKRSIAVGYAMTLTGFGPIIMPLWISYLLDQYGTSGCMLLIGGMSLNCLVAAVLLQPLKWHMKEKILDQELVPLDEKKTNGFEESLIQIEKPPNKESLDDNINEIRNSTLSIDHDVETKSIYGFETPLPRRKVSESSNYEGKRWKRTYNRSISQPEKKQISVSVNSLYSLKSLPEEKETVISKNNENKEIVQTKKKESFSKRMINFFDLNLLKDPIYLNLMFGMSLAVCAEINFSLLTPFILDNFKFSTLEIAQIMSTLATADIIFRFCAPFIAEKLNFSPKVMYTLSLVMLIVSRTALIFVREFIATIIVAVALGIAKGFRTVYMSLLIPSYVPLEKLASASGFQMVTNGVINLITGPILGLLRDTYGDYNICIIVINAITCSTLLMWSVEYLYINFFKKNR